MIDTYEKFRFIDKQSHNDLFAEVNWKDDERIQGCKVVKFKLGDKEAIVDVIELNQMLFSIGTPDAQRQLIPQKIRKSRWYETIISVKAKKNIQKGEEITFPLKITLPTDEEIAISEIKKEKKEKEEKTKAGLIIPKK